MKRYTAVILLIAVFSSADTLVLQPGEVGKDSIVYNTYPEANYGDHESLVIGKLDNEYRTLIEWDISDLPEGAEITSAVMELYCHVLFGEPSGSIKAYRIIETWEESTVNWANQPDYDFADFITGDWPEVEEWAYLDVTAQVAAWYEEEYTNCGIIGTGIYNNCAATFWSSDYTEDQTLLPRLTIEYTPGDAAVAPSSLGVVKAAYR